MAENPHPNTLPRKVPCTVAGGSIDAYYKTFSTGSRGWHATGKIEVDGVPCQVNLLITIIGSKPVPEGAQKDTATEIAQDAPPTASPLFPPDDAPKHTKTPPRGRK